MLVFRNTSLSASAASRVRRLAAASVGVSLALVVSMLSATPANAATDSGTSGPTGFSISRSSVSTLSHNYTAGNYIVRLKGAPAATYTGGVAGFSATRPVKGRQLNARSSAVTSYVGHLRSAQKSVAATYGIHTAYTFAVAYNGFAAKLTANQANQLAADASVASLVKSKRLKVQVDDDSLTSMSSLNYLHVAGNADGDVWKTLGGHANAGKNIVVGDIDTGIAPENPSFAGAPLATSSSSSEAWTSTAGSTTTVHFTKANGAQFTSTEEQGSGLASQWNSSFYTQKIIGARSFNEGFTLGTPLASAAAAVPEYNSPRDGDGHGSHTASTAAGNYGVPAVVTDPVSGIATSFGDISGVAPAARIAVYKACWTAVKEEDTGCDEVDLVAAIDQAVADGVDVINYSIGGGAATTVDSPTDDAFLNAAAAGIFVSAAAGNAGPGATTLDNAAPWETTVAASTVPSYEATVVLGNGKKYVGGSITVPAGGLDSAPLVLAKAVKKKTTMDAHAADCRTGSLNPAKAAGTIVVCDRDGVIPRTEMSQTVQKAGGVGMVLVNTHVNSIDLDSHAVPTVHVDQPSRAAIRAYAAKKGATASLLPVAEAGTVNASPPVPQVAGFSSRGPVAAGGGDVLKPDISAPGVGILAAVATSNPGGGPVNHWEFYSGTSMATPHITGLAALYLGAHPAAQPAEIKSALMTTAGDVKTATGAVETNPFIRGAGEVAPPAFLEPGLVYPAGVADWDSYLQGLGNKEFGPAVTPIDASDLNQASIAIGSLVASQTVKRSVVVKEAGTYSAAAQVAGGVVTVTPATFTAVAGDVVPFTVTIARTTAPIGKWATGSLTWTGAGHVVRSPIAVKSAAIPLTVHGTGTNGTTDVSVSFGAKKTVKITTAGLAYSGRWRDPAHQENNYSGKFTAQSTRDSDDYSNLDEALLRPRQIYTGTSYIRFTTAPVVPTAGVDLDLYVFYSKRAPQRESDLKFIGGSSTTKMSETFSIDHPKAGFYFTLTDPYALPAIAPGDGITYNDTAYEFRNGYGEGHFNSSVTSIHSTATGVNTFRLGWGDMNANDSYLGLVRYSGTSTKTIVTVDAPVATPVVHVSPAVISGTPVEGGTLRASVGTWNIDHRWFSVFDYRWYSNGVAIPGANTPIYVLKSADVGKDITFGGEAQSGAAPALHYLSQAVHVTAKPTVTFSFADSSISHAEQAQLLVTVTSSAGAPTGATPIRVTYGKKSFVTNYEAGVPVLLPKIKKGSYAVKVTFLGNSAIGAGSSSVHKLKVS